MRNLRERLMAVSSKPAEKRPPPPQREGAFFLREGLAPLEALRGVERTTLPEIRACDPLFSGTAWEPERLLFLDTETTGLSGGAGTVAFEIGVGRLTPEGLRIRQYVMRDYAEEGAMLCEIAALLRGCQAVVTFNGKAFDLPLLQSRLVMNRIRLDLTALPHFDLLHACRRVYKLRLGHCNLGALEEAVLGRAREDDLPGALVPQRYFDYLKTGEFALLEDVLRHNFTDVVSLAELTGHLCAVFRAPLTLEHPEDIYGVGRTLLRAGRTETARRCFHVLGRTSLAPQAHMRLADSYKCSREWGEAERTLRGMIAAGEGGVWPYVELAKYCEHVSRDVPEALRLSRAALMRALDAEALGGADEREIAALRRRVERLRKKLEAERIRQAKQAKE